jgi:predicted outer membrane repeat protein
VRSCEFDGNVALGLGGAIATDVSADVTVAGCAIHGNVAGAGGGVCLSASTGLVIGCDIWGNSADFGGGVTFMSATGARIEESEIRGNVANCSGGGVYASDASFVIASATIAGNTSLADGGGLWLLSSTATIDSSAIDGNSAASSGDGMFVDGGAIQVRHGSIAGNGVGVHVDEFNGGSVDARRNWWGDATGPFHGSLNPGGRGDQVSDRVLFDPWLVTSGVDGSPHALSTWSALKASYR